MTPHHCGLVIWDLSLSKKSARSTCVQGHFVEWSYVLRV